MAILILATSLVFQVSAVELAILIIMCCLVLTTELLNTGLERCLDLVESRLSAQVKVAKDVLAGAVLLTSLGAILVGLLILGPKVLSLLSI